MKSHHQRFTSLITCLILLSGPLSADSVVEEIIARVNNLIITRSEYVHEKQQMEQEARQQDATNVDKLIVERDRDVLRGLIDQSLLLDKAKELSISADTELVKRLDEIRKQMNLETIEDVGKAAEAQGVSFEDFKQNVKNQILTQKVIGDQVHVQVTKEEGQRYYDEHRNEMKQPEQIRLSEILVATPKQATDPTPEQLAAAEEKANNLLQQIKSGTAFEEVAKKNSDDTSGAQGGDLGFFKRDGTLKELEDRLFAMKTGEISDPIRTRQGLVILKVTEHIAASILPLKEIEPKVQEAVYLEKLQPALREYLTKLREDAFIWIKPGYIDTGASAKQTNPIETTLKEASAKKLKKKKKLGLF